MVEIFVRLTLLFHGVQIVGELAVQGCGSVDNRDNSVNGDLRPDFRPIERANQWLRDGKSRSFDDDVVRLRIAVQELSNRRSEFLRDRAADAAVGQLHDAAFLAAFDAAPVQNFSVDPQVAEFIDDQGNPLSFGVFEDVPYHCCFAGTKKACNHRCWCL